MRYNTLIDNKFIFENNKITYANKVNSERRAILSTLY